ncbi:hypothetical protein D3C74_382510 [compost metagenome]
MAYGIYEGDGMIEPISIKKTDGMFVSKIYEENGLLVISHTCDKDDHNEPMQTIRVHPSDFVDFYEMVNEAASYFHQRKCHWSDRLCVYDFKCNNCKWNVRDVE